MAATPPIEANKYHTGCFARQAGQRVRVGATSLAQLRHVIWRPLFAAKDAQATQKWIGGSVLCLCAFLWLHSNIGPQGKVIRNFDFFIDPKSSGFQSA